MAKFLLEQRNHIRGIYSHCVILSLVRHIVFQSDVVSLEVSGARNSARDWIFSRVLSHRASWDFCGSSVFSGLVNIRKSPVCVLLTPGHISYNKMYEKPTNAE